MFLLPLFIRLPDQVNQILLCQYDIGSRVSTFVDLILFETECRIVYTCFPYSRYTTNRTNSIATALKIVTGSK
jgi:hypothetical protein